MGFTKKNGSTNTVCRNDNAVVSITGTLVDVIDGKKFNYAVIRADRTVINQRTNKPYYDEISVKFDKSITLPDDECEVSVTATISTYFDRDINRMLIILNGDKCEVSNVEEKCC